MPRNTDIIKNSNRKIYFTITGGGVGSISQILETGGASNVFVGANIPYSAIELREIIPDVDKSVTKEVSELLALNSKMKSEDIGVGVTCKLMKNNEREGREHKVYMTIADRLRVRSYEFTPTGLCRYEQEINTNNFIIDTLTKFISEKEVFDV